MSRTSGKTSHSIGFGIKSNLGGFFAATFIYVGFSVYLYQPYFQHFKTIQYLFVVNVCLASMGCYILSRRWVVSFIGSFFAGAIYGFGPFSLGLAGYHPTVGFLAAAVPWLFLPATYGPKGKFRWLRIPLSALPFLGIVVFFQVSAYYRLFAVPTQAKLYLYDLGGLLAPLVMAERSMVVVGFYHIPIAALVMGFSMLLMARRFGIMVILCIGVILAFCSLGLNISPIMWLTIPVLCCAILIGAGTDGLAFAGSSDRKWIFASALIMAALSATTFFLAMKYRNTFAGLGLNHAKLLTESCKMYALGTITVAIIYILTLAKLRVHWLRLAVLCFSIGVDIFFSARFIVDKIF
ncbi:MAG: hypothetical protein KAS75_01695 [Planctomycetes bacterium]|nr:hypothetical protein [Planctomycetota bacterium]